MLGASIAIETICTAWAISDWGRASPNQGPSWIDLRRWQEELFCLLHFLDPETFGDPEDFLAKFGTVDRTEQVHSIGQ